MPTPATRESLLDLLDAGELLLLPTTHAARELRSAYDARQRDRHLAAWQPARALSWPQWTTSLYAELIVTGAETRILLNPAQEHALWRALIAADPSADALTSPDALAQLAASAYSLAAAWLATPRLRHAATSDDTRTFARWAEAFDARCQRDRCLPLAALDTTLATSAVPAPPTLRLVGFPSLTPAQQQLANALTARGTEILHLQPIANVLTPTHHHLLCPTPHDELTFAARWLRHTLTSPHPPQRIAVLVPGLGSGNAAERTAFDSILRTTLAPELDAIDADLSSTPWEFSTAAPLPSIPLIADALDLVRWVLNPLPQPRISALLLSPYLNPSDQRDHSARLDHRLRSRERRLRPELSLDAFLRLLDFHSSPLDWPRQLARALSDAGSLTRPRSYADWMELARRLVHATGWPAAESRPLNPTDFAATRAWDGALDSIATLDFTGQRVSFATAFQALDQQLQSTAFHPPSTHAAVQILRPDQATGTLFDAILYLHATDQNLPAAERPHPLLSLALQSQLHMPGTDATATTQRSRIALDALLLSTPTALFTSAHEDENGALRVSPLLEESGITLTPDPLPTPTPPTQLACDAVPDDTPLPPLPAHQIRGGARVLQLQAACGFRAFAELRLGTAEPETSDLGLDVRDSGTLVHRILQLLWEPVGDDLRTQAQIAALSEAELATELARHIDRALARIPTSLDAPWDAAYLSVLRERLLDILTLWVSLERQRSPFAVLAVEHKEPVTVGPLELQVRLDRLDQIATVDEAGNPTFANVLVDYKTGSSASPSKWLTPRPDEPQLPLYTLLFGDEAPQRIKAITFAKLVAGEAMRWHGLQAEDGLLPGHKIEDLQLRLAEWHEELTRLAHAFADGDADVAPKLYPDTCKHCNMQLLCRVGELHLNSAASDTDDDTTEDGDE